MPSNSASVKTTAAETLFSAALDHPAEERPTYLAEACKEDHLLLRRVEALLRAHEAPRGFLPEDPAPTPGGAVPSAVGAGDLVGPYKVLEKIGEGGFGIVYVAEQTEPLRRQVALKIIKLGMDTQQVVARFQAERQALALMDHPNIARVLDAGALESGRPYFVMELVRGVKITEYCDQTSLSIAQRLDLFVQICQAVQHAHQKGIIHRDLKPSNLLVATHDGRPVPKIIDFGIAKATQGQLAGQTVHTRFEQFMGTPAYMSPEQAAMSSLDVDTRSDIYSLGVLLYELLTGRTPFSSDKLFDSGLDEMRRIIREQEAARPSALLAAMPVADLKTAATRRRAEPARLIHSVRGELDWIVMRCLEKDRARRYETASELAADVQRHLVGEPVLACPPSAVYRARKLAQRNKGVFAAAGAVAAALVLGLAASLWQAYRATQAERNEIKLRQQAEMEELKAKQAEHQARIEAEKNRLSGEVVGNTFLILAQAIEMSGSGPALKALLDQSVNQLESDHGSDQMGVRLPGWRWYHSAYNASTLKDEPEARAYVLSALGRIYLQLNETGTAEALQQKALALRRKALGDNDPEVADSLLLLAEVRLERSDFASAEKNYQEAERIDPTVWDRNSDHLGQRGASLAQHGHYQEAVPYLARAIDADPSEHWGYYMLAPVLVQVGEISRYQAHCKTLLQRFDATTNFQIANRMAMSCLLAPNAVGPEDLMHVVKMAKFAASKANFWRLMTMALAEYRQGHPDAAIEWANASQKRFLQADPSLSQASCLVDTWLIIAMSQQKLNHPEEARAALEHGVDLIHKEIGNPGDLGEDWWYDKLMSLILMREAQATVAAKGSGQ